jgi:putative transposase
MVLRLVADLIGLLVLTVRSRRSIQAENLVLRRQLALFKERGAKPRRVDTPARLSLAWLSRLCDWRSSVMVVRPETMVRWHRAGWRLFWRYKSRPERPPIPLELRQLIRRMASENPLWGEERIANELFVKLGIRVSPRTVSKYMPKRPSGQPRGDQRWSTFLKNHAKAILACDFFVAVTVTFRMLYVFVVIEARRAASVAYQCGQRTRPPIGPCSSCGKSWGMEEGIVILSTIEIRSSPSTSTIRSGPWESKYCAHQSRVRRPIRFANA